ncbi:hypothetical protein FGO68_gene9698 [Halteria grandinella]|uniref:EF-hand domain-containing protein n=1 Tax=Halteria grandinella TaxID=5974 RepID=A0A8J8T961_HALGN|nr:hypothetical protein FGO68_gene9698 [Halteria grandinella]
MDSSKGNDDISWVIEATKKAQEQLGLPSSQPKVDKQKMIENSRQKFLKNLGDQIKEGKNPQPPCATATGKERSKSKNKSHSKKRGDEETTMKVEVPKKAARPASSKPPAKGGAGQKENTSNNHKKTAPSFTKPDNMLTIPNYGQMSEASSKRQSYSIRDQLMDQIKECLHQPKKLDEIKQANLHLRIDFNTLVHQAKLQKIKEQKQPSVTNEVENGIMKRMEQNKQLIERLRGIKPTPPPYANSVLQAALFNKGRVLEALLSVLQNSDARKYQLSECDDKHRNAVIYAAAHGAHDSLELLSAAEAPFNGTDQYHRTALHYAAMNDNSKPIEAVFLGFKSQGKPIQVYGQKEEDGNSPMKHAPKPTFTPHKGVFDHMGPLTKKVPRPVPQPIEEDNDFEVDQTQEEGATFTVHHEEGALQQNLVNFFTKKTILEALTDEDALKQKMTKIDQLCVPKGGPSPAEISFMDDDEDNPYVGAPQIALQPSSIVNFRDIRGRTPLFIAVAFNNRVALESLLFLGANPHIADIYGQRPIDIANDDGVRDLLLNKMGRMQAPARLYQMEKFKAREGSAAAMAAKAQAQKAYESKKQASGTPHGETTEIGAGLGNLSSYGGSNISQSKKNVGLIGQYPLDVNNLKAMLTEKIMLSKIGLENDNYLQYAIKNKAFDSCLYLLTLPNANFDLTYPNGSGNTALHLAIKTGQLKFVKLLLLKLSYLSSQDTTDLDDPKYFNMKVVKDTAFILNRKGLTPLLQSVEQGVFPIFRLMLELYYHYDTVVVEGDAQKGLLDKVIQGYKCQEKKENAFLKAVRLNHKEMIYSLLDYIVNNPSLPQEVWTSQDGVTQRNALHWAVINKERNLIDQLVVKLDADKGLLRGMEDSKKKRPAEYGEQYTELMSTVWDYARDGNVRKLRQCIELGRFEADQQTQWMKNTPLHIAVKGIKLEIIKVLVHDYSLNPNITFNSLQKTPLHLAGQLTPPKGSTATPEAIQSHVKGLLLKLHSSTKLPTDTLAKQERQKLKQLKLNELKRLKKELNDKIAKRGLNIETFFQKFDRNGDGVFSHLEFECAFTALGIDVAKEDLRRFIDMTDANKDGRVDFNEFYSVLNEPEIDEDDMERAGIVTTEAELDASFEQME